MVGGNQINPALRQHLPQLLLLLRAAERRRTFGYRSELFHAVFIQHQVMRAGLCGHIQPALLGGMDHFNRSGGADVHKMQPAAGTLTVEQRPGYRLKLRHRRPGSREIPCSGPPAADSPR
ncbi:hypothetical protein D3C73_1293670 [compost metagenome]